MNAREVIAELYDERHPDDDPGELADDLLQALAEAGYTVARLGWVETREERPTVCEHQGGGPNGVCAACDRDKVTPLSLYRILPDPSSPIPNRAEGGTE